jgi:hypothetical protein
VAPAQKTPEMMWVIRNININRPIVYLLRLSCSPIVPDFAKLNVLNEIPGEFCQDLNLWQNHTTLGSFILFLAAYVLVIASAITFRLGF